MAEQDIQEWVGRSETCDDNIDPGHIQKMAAALDVAEPPKSGDVLPLLWHWGLFIAPAPYSELGADGHPQLTGILPPAANRRRMWAGGRIEFIHPLLVGTPAQRKSTVLAINEKQGRSGKLVFITVQHEYTQNFVQCLREEQDIVYREPVTLNTSPGKPAPEADWAETVEPTPTMLFRYSAVTFNGHRIHYDQDYTTQQEGYPGLVVHGPLIATLMCRAFRHAHHDKVATSLSYRGVRPLFSPEPFSVAGRLVDAEDHEASDETTGLAELWAEQNGTLAHHAHIRFKV